MTRAAIGFLVGAALLLLAGCGYHLRGAVELPPEMARTYIEAAKVDQPLARRIAELLRHNGVEVVEGSRQATAVLALSEIRSDRRMISVDAAGRAQAYELQSELSFTLRGEEGRVLIPHQRIEVKRDFLFDPANVLSKGNEESQLRDTMQQDLLRILLQRLRFHADPAQ